VININNERCTFLEALAMSGGLDLYTRRDRIGVMREVDGKRIIHYLDPRSVSVFDDEFFLLQQNDIIFTEVSPRRYFTEGLSSWHLVLSAISAITSALGIYKVLDSYIRPN
jgi:polysaccharide export outer membrane protein